MSAIRAWHFTDGPTCRYDDRPIVAGETLSVEGDLVMCRHGLHASRSPLDALRYAPGAWAWRVDCWGDVQEQDDKRSVVGGRRLFRGRPTGHL